MDIGREHDEVIVEPLEDPFAEPDPDADPDPVEAPDEVEVPA